MLDRQTQSEYRFKTYEVVAEDFELYPGFGISPGVVIGRDVRSGDMLTADWCGHTATVYFNPMNNSYRVMFFISSDASTLSAPERASSRNEEMGCAS